MYKIYFENRQIDICDENERYIEDANSVVLRMGGGQDFGQCDSEVRCKSYLGPLIEMFETSESLRKLYIPSRNPDRFFKQICKCFSEIDAGGGLVKNKRGDFLMIFRNGKWDLPKGKREKGEKKASAALREVMEETGLKDLEAGEIICVTHHCYRWKGKGELILKHTYWYSMEYTVPVELIPQTEEDITKAAWIAPSSLPQFLDNTYPSIVEVFKEARII